MKRIATIVTIVAALAMAAAACGGTGSVIIPSVGEPGGPHAAPSTELYCAIEARAVPAVTSFLAEGVRPAGELSSLADASRLASTAAAAAPHAITDDLNIRSRMLAMVVHAVAKSGFDVAGLGPRVGSPGRSPTFLAAVDRIGAYDLRVCGFEKS